ncbi:MAG: phosphoribosyltransferase [Pollutimonas bauzanensis]|uniref:Predicted phosphoribosyltransferase n=1 Tax=Pollutimonas bauzanensis TaxID=658167 RepID=A0A1M5SPW9_9BURK|nr:phosphoribosyltransferase [Pollutimonas bauzanensis]SHH40569.1 Predicted phosphoribosyltransferase [Pollutimonas bauzanensis]
MSALFKDRKDAGRRLGALLAKRYGGRQDVLVLGLPRGGVPVAYEVARALGAALDVLIVRKLGLPQHKEYAMGAIASGGVTVLDQDIVRGMGVSQEALDAVVAAEQAELLRREAAYRGDAPASPLGGRTVILVDDGLATGSTMRAAIAAARHGEPLCIVVAAPVGAPETCEAIRPQVDDLVCLAQPELFRAVGLWYQDFPQTSDREVQELLAKRRPDSLGKLA